MTIARPVPLDPSIASALAYRAPWLVEKALDEHVAATADEAERLFDEVKKYLLLPRLEPGGPFAMTSRRVDAVWHLFVLFTEPYTQFCDEHFGRFVHHRPRQWPEGAPDPRSPVEIRNAFVEAYERRFGPPAPEWDDAAGVTLRSRLAARAGLVARETGGRAELALPDGPALVRVDGWALPALRFAADERLFLVRELPGLAPDDRLALGRGLVASHACQLAL